MLLCFSVLPLLNLAAQEEAAKNAGTKAVSKAPDEETVSAANWFGKSFFSFGISIFVLQEEYGFEAAPVPILPTPSLAFTLPPVGTENVGAALELTLDMYFTNYKYSYTLNRPLPTEIENRSAFVFGPVTALQLQVYLNISKFKLRANAGISSDWRIVFRAADLNEADLEDADKQAENIKFFYKTPVRWLYPVAGLGFDFRFTPRWYGGLDVRVWAPLDFGGMDQKFLGWRFGLGLRISRKNGIR
jgi:hypothetical protein